MGFLNIFRKKDSVMKLGSPMKGRCLSIKEVPDPAFSEELMGRGIAVIPTDGRVYAPLDGMISSIVRSGHAVAMTSLNGVELLIHIGLDTVSLKGEPFSVKVKNGQKVKKGDLLIVADLGKIKEAGKEIITPLVICDTGSYNNVETLIDKDVEPGDEVVKLVSLRS